MLDQVTRMLPVDQARGALLPPVRLLREAAVVVARTARHWEIVLAGEDPADRARWRVLSETLMGARGTRTSAGVRQHEGSWGRLAEGGSDSGTDTDPDSDTSFSSAAMSSASSQEHPAEGRDDVDLVDDVDDVDLTDLTDLTAFSGADLPVEGWAELSFADAQARVSGLDEQSLQTLLSYERSHGHRPLFEQMLDHRLAAAVDAGPSA